MEISRATNACTRTTHKLELKVLENTEKFRSAFNQISLSVPKAQAIGHIRLISESDLQQYKNPRKPGPKLKKR